MKYEQFIKVLQETKPTTRVLVEDLRRIVNERHEGVGQVAFRFFEDFPGAQLGSFTWLEDERTSPYQDPFNDAIVFINDRYRNDREMIRLIAAKELMHVFDTDEQKTDSPEKYKTLLKQIESSPIVDDQSEQYAADRVALWKATIALVPPCIRSEYLEGWRNGEIKAPEISAKLWLPDATISACMGDYYDVAVERFLSEKAGQA